MNVDNKTSNTSLNKKKRISYKRASEERLGETRLNTMGSKMWIIEYVTNNNITVQFENGFTVKTYYQEFLKGKVKNPYDISVYNVGYLGEGVYKTWTNGERSRQYKCWSQMLSRCYSSKVQEKHPTYKGCTVCEEWHNYQNFAKWYDENIIEVEGEKIALDKDLLIKNNKIYSPQNCCFLPQPLNTILVKSNSIRGLNPIGLTFNKRANKYYVNCCDGNGKIKYLGSFNSKDQAFKTYKEYKESVIKSQAKKYKEYISKKSYQALIEYKVDVDD